MKLSLRAKQLTKKLTLLSTAFVLAVSTLTASVPFILSSDVAAVNPNCEVEFSQNHQICVSTLSELNAALGNTQYSQIIVNDTIETTTPILITRPLTLNGHDEKIKFVGDASGWQGNYVVKVFNTTGVNINSLQLEGGDAGLQVNVSEVNLSGNMGFASHEFGNIELTKSSDASLTRAPKLSVASQGTLAGDKNTTATKPYVWVANNAVNDAIVSSFFLRGLNRTPNQANKAQHWYFTNPSFTGVVATNVTANKVYASSQEAVNEATGGDVVRLDGNETLQTALVLDKAITFDGNNKVLTAAYSHTGVPADNGKKNTVVVVASNNVVVKNLTTTNSATGQKPHGVVVDNKTGVVFDNLRLTNGRAGAILNGSNVTATNITTQGNSWYGINVDGAGSALNISGLNSHDSNVYAIYAENKSNVSITTDAQYAKIDNPVDSVSRTTDVAYILKSAAPVASITVNGSDANVIANDKTDIVTVQGNAAGPNDPKYHYFMITAPGKSETIVHIINSTSRNVSFNLRDVPGVPLEGSAGKLRLKSGSYNIRYVLFDSNNVRNDTVVSETINLTVDNAAPTATVELSNDFIVSNSTLPTLTVTGTDAATGISAAEYKIVVADNPELTVVGWTAVQNGISTVLSSLAGLPDGTYAVAVAVYDGAGNRYRHEAIEFEINRELTVTFSVSSLQTSTPNLNGTLHYANGEPVANQDLIVLVNAVEYTVKTSATGAWSRTFTGLTNGSYDVKVLFGGSVIVKDEFVIAVPALPAPLTVTTTTNTSQGAPNSTPRVPTFVSPAAVAGILGDSTEANNDDVADDQAVEGMSTLEKAAQAVDADNTDGTAMGLAWYWWVLIAAGLALLGWWIAAAIRRRQAE